MSPLWSYVLCIVGFTIMWLAGNKRWEAWLLGLLNQFIWAAYAVLSGQTGFLFGAAVYGTVYARNLCKWVRTR